MTAYRCVVVALALSLAVTPVLAAEQEGAEESEKTTPCPLRVPVQADIHPDFKEADRVEAIRKHDAPQRIINYIACDLHENNYKVAKPFRLNVLITDFRLRSGASAFWVGAMAGADRLAIRVTVQPESGPPYEFSTNTGTTKGGFVKPDPRQRINYMAKDLARKISRQLEGQGYVSR